MELKNIYIQKVEEQLTEWTMEIENLEERAGKAIAQARIAYLKKVDDLKAKQNAAQVTLKSLKEASEESWEDLKIGYEKLQQDIRKSIENAHTSIK